MLRRRPHHRRSALAASLIAAFALGILPPAFGRQGPPPTVLERVAVPAAALEPDDGLLRATGGKLAGPHGGWTGEHRVCADSTFTAAGITWDQQGDATVPVNLHWGKGGGDVATVRTWADPDHAPDPGTEGQPRDGTDLVWTGETRCVSFAMNLEPGTSVSDVEVVLVDTSGADEEPSLLGSIASGVQAGLARIWGLASPEEAAAAATKPAIIRRAQWGADERKRNCGPNYAPKLKMAYVHHTVNSNTYTRSQADDLMRGIYAYHTDGRGFCDIAYNFLVDRFGRIYEGRYGGMTRPVIGGHAMGFNTGSTGVAVIGDFQNHAVPTRVVAGLKRLLAWRLDVAHLNPKGKATMTSAGGSNQKYDKGEKVRLPVISGHRQTGYTTCPGDRLWNKLRRIRDVVYTRGLPKLWNVRASSRRIDLDHPSVRYRARISAALPWTADLTGDAGVVRTWTGAGERIDVTWDGRDKAGLPVAKGSYRLTMRTQDGTEAARPGILRTIVDARCDQTAPASGGTLEGTMGDDVLCGGPGPDHLIGYGGNDVLIGRGGNDHLQGYAGDDVLLGGPGGDLLEGGDDHDTLDGHRGHDTLRGKDGDDSLDGGPGNDDLDGNLGRDRASFAGTSGVKVNLAAGTATGSGTDSLAGIEDVTGSATRDRLVGDAAPNRLAGGGGKDVLRGLGGNDVLLGGPSNDRLEGGPGDDTLGGGGGKDAAVYAHAAAAITANLRAGTATGDGDDVLRGVSVLIGGPKGDTLRGSPGPDRLNGLAGWDRLVGRGGRDVLIGGGGRDTLRGGPGSDVLRLRDGSGDAADGGGGRDVAFADRKDRLRQVEQRR